MSPPPAEFIDLSTTQRGGEPAALPSTQSATSDQAMRALSRPVAIDREAVQWLAFLTTLKARVAAGNITAAQRASFLLSWDRAVRQQPTLRRPAVGVSADGMLQASWSFSDPRRHVFTLDIDREGGVAWFYRDAETGEACGTDDASTAELPDDALRLLAMVGAR